MSDVAVVLLIILAIALVVRGPKTLPQIGAMFGRGYRASREEAERIRSKDQPTTETRTETTTPDPGAPANPRPPANPETPANPEPPAS